MSDAVIVLITFVFGGVVAYYVLRSTVGTKNYEAGYFHGFNEARDLKVAEDEKTTALRLKKLRKTGPKLVVVKGNKT